MGYVVRMPQLGMTMEEGIVVEWCVDPDEEFEEGTTIIVIESEKTANEIEAREAGVLLERFVELDEAVEPGAPIAYVGEAGSAVPENVRAEVAGGASAQQSDTDSEGAPEAAATGVAGSTSGAGVDPGARARVSPRARTYAAEHDLSVEGIEGSGPGGAVIEQDVIAAESSGATGPATGVGAEGRNIVEERSGTPLRRTIAKRMTQSTREAPQVTLNRRVEMDDLLALKERLAEDLDTSISLTDFIVAAVVEAVEKYPEFNAIYEESTHKLVSNVNVGLALAIEGGLVTPVLHGADQLGLTELTQRRSALVSRVLDGDYTGDDLSNGTITITNLGHFGVESFDPILNPPEVAILGVNALQTELDPETREPVETLGLSLTFDHRAVDGADAAQFLQAINDALTHPLRLLSLESATTTTEGPDGFERVSYDLDERTARASHEGGMQASVRTHSFAWTADEPEEMGGTDSAPNPVEQFLGSLSACFTLMIANIAERRGVEITDVDVTVRGGPEEGAIETIDIEVDVSSEDDEQQVKRVVQTAERACYVSRAVSEDIERSLDITVHAP